MSEISPWREYGWEPKDPVDLWVLAPPWPHSEKSVSMTLSYLLRCSEISNRDAHLVLWMPADELYRTELNPLEIRGWRCGGVVVSGSDPLHVGYCYSKGTSLVTWNTKLILDERGKRGTSSSKAMKFVLDKLTSGPDNVVADPFTHESAVLPIWCRRLGHRYSGRTRSRITHKKVTKALAQVELPGIQLSLPT